MTGDRITRVYGSFRGVDFRGDDINLSRSPDSLNMWKDYRQTDSIRTRPSMDICQGFQDTVYGVFFFRDMMIVHAGEKLYKVAEDVTEIFTSAARTVSDCFVYEDVFYFKDGVNYLRYDGETVSEVEGYVPATSIGRKPSGGGTMHEDVNMLNGERINTFLADGGSFDFHLDTKAIDSDYIPIVKVNDEVMTDSADYEVDFQNGVVMFQEAPPAPPTDGQDNVSVQFRKTVPGYRESILGCTLLQVFDNRVFFSGNPTYPNVVWHCSLNDPSYVSDLDFYREGMDSSPVRGMVAGNNALWVFREPSDANTTVFYHVPTIDDVYGKIYPSSHSSVTTGCVGRAINFGDDIVFFSERGMEGISGDITTEQVIGHRSTLADRKLITELGYREMILTEWEGYLLVFIGAKCYLADSRSAFSNENHLEYDWFCWEMEKPIRSARVHDNILYLGTDDGVYTLTGDGDLESWWTTPKDKFGSLNMQKTTNKRGCVGEGTGDIQILVKTENTEFELIGSYEDVTDYFVSRIKRKKFKDLQIKFYSQTRFSLETLSLEVWQGGYIKR